ncbi:MAG: FUSC family protein [Puia sp.]|nr:FUSC family protein [Puia sp.]
MTRKYADLLLYILKSLIGVTIGFYLYRLYPTIGAWALFSILLVLAPDRKDSVTLAVTRIKANIVGAAIGLCIFFIHPINLFMICIGIAAALIFCELLKLQAATRSAAIAVLIITMHEPGSYFWEIAIERAAGVILGCIIGVIITYLFHNIHLRYKQTSKEN